MTKILAKFPFDDPTLKELAFLNPRNRDKSFAAGSSRLVSKFGTFTSDEMDSLEVEFHDFHASLDADLPVYDPQVSSGITMQLTLLALDEY